LTALTIYPEDNRVTTSQNKLGITHFEDYLGNRVIPFSSARAAMIFPLKRIANQGTEEIFIPRYLSQCVTSALGKAILPARRPSEATRAILVYHQYGYPQRLDLIEQEASLNGWTIVNNCVNAMFTRVDNQSLLGWGDYSIFSFPKFYHCTMGGGLCMNKSDLFSEADQVRYEQQFDDHQNLADRAYDQLTKSKSLYVEFERYCSIEAVYGYLPELISMPQKALEQLPSTFADLEKDVLRRRNILEILDSELPGRTPELNPNEWVVPFAIPISGDFEALTCCSNQILDALNVHAPVLNFDYARNMLNPKFEPALILGTHIGWDNTVIKQIIEIVNDY
jgi:hypothetical protein